MKKKVLVAEDESALASILAKKIEKLGYLSIVAENGIVAIDKIRSEQPDLVLLDLRMPEKDGFEVLQAIKQEDENSVPVIVFSNYDEDTKKEKAMKLGAQEYIVKSDITLRFLSIKLNEILAD